MRKLLFLARHFEPQGGESALCVTKELRTIKFPRAVQRCQPILCRIRNWKQLHAGRERPIGWTELLNNFNFGVTLGWTWTNDFFVYIQVSNGKTWATYSYSAMITTIVTVGSTHQTFILQLSSIVFYRKDSKRNAGTSYSLAIQCHRKW